LIFWENFFHSPKIHAFFQHFPPPPPLTTRPRPLENETPQTQQILPWYSDETNAQKARCVDTYAPGESILADTAIRKGVDRVMTPKAALRAAPPCILTNEVAVLV
jgi:hypothetical protein